MIIKVYHKPDREFFIHAWANALVNESYEDIIIIIDGIPLDDMTDEEYKKFQELEDEMVIKQNELHALKMEAEAALREANAKAAENMARLLAAHERNRDLEQLEALQKKLGIS